MKIKLFKRIASVMLACMMVLGLSTMAFAAEKNVPSEDSCNTEDTTVSLYSNETVIGTVYPNGTSLVLYPKLSNYIGTHKHITIKTYSSATTGALDIELKDPDGWLRSDGNWLMGVNDEGTWDIMFPKAGQYTLIVNPKGINASVTVTATWD